MCSCTSCDKKCVNTSTAEQCYFADRRVIWLCFRRRNGESRMTDCEFSIVPDLPSNRTGTGQRTPGPPHFRVNPFSFSESKRAFRWLSIVGSSAFRLFSPATVANAVGRVLDAIIIHNKYSASSPLCNSHSYGCGRAIEYYIFNECSGRSNRIGTI